MAPPRTLRVQHHAPPRRARGITTATRRHDAHAGTVACVAAAVLVLSVASWLAPHAHASFATPRSMERRGGTPARAGAPSHGMPASSLAITQSMGANPNPGASHVQAKLSAPSAAHAPGAELSDGSRAALGSPPPSGTRGMALTDAPPEPIIQHPVFNVEGANVPSPDNDVNGVYAFVRSESNAPAFRKVHPKMPHGIDINLYSVVAVSVQRIWFLEKLRDGRKYDMFYCVSEAHLPPATGWLQADYGSYPPPTTSVYHGTCNATGHCECAEYYFGDSCKLKCVAKTQCSGHGSCLPSGQCSCNSPFAGTDCSDCGDNGVWHNTTGTCHCNDQYQGTYCDQRIWFWERWSRRTKMEVGGAALGALVIAVACCCTCCYKRRLCCWQGVTSDKDPDDIYNSGVHGSPAVNPEGRPFLHSRSDSEVWQAHQTDDTYGRPTEAGLDDNWRGTVARDDSLGEDVRPHYGFGGDRDEGRWDDETR